MNDQQRLRIETAVSVTSRILCQLEDMIDGAKENYSEMMRNSPGEVYSMIGQELAFRIERDLRACASEASDE